MFSKCLTLILLLLVAGFISKAQQPWKSPLMIASSADGITFEPASVFQDSSGVPSIIHWKGDTLIAAFQWFRLPNPSDTWDRVAVKFSYNMGLTWTDPVPIRIANMPSGSQRAFDPALTALNRDSIRIYFSSSPGMPVGGLDSTVNTYSAISTNGINFNFESSPRVDVSDKPVIDPTVIRFNNLWHYVAPAGAPWQGAYHFISENGIQFNRVQMIQSDSMHNWTGNFTIKDSNELRFYGSSPDRIWYSPSANGGVWNGYIPTNIRGGDPAVIRTGPNSWLMIFVGQPYATSGITEVVIQSRSGMKVFPNPAQDALTISVQEIENLKVYDANGRICLENQLLAGVNVLDVSGLKPGIYFLRTESDSQFIRLLITGKN